MTSRGRAATADGAGLAYVVVCVVVGVVLAAQGIEWGLIAYADPLVRSGEIVLGVVLATAVRRGSDRPDGRP